MMDLISVYSRREALADGLQVQLDADLCREAGFVFPVYMTRAAWEAAIGAGGTWRAEADGDETEILDLPLGQDCTGRTWDVLVVLYFRIGATRGQDLRRLPFAVGVYAYDGKPHTQTVHLVSECGPIDFDDAAPAITIMLPEED